MCEGISIVSGRPVVVDLETGAVRTLVEIEDATWLGFDDGAAPGTLRYAGWDGTGSRIGRAGAWLWSDAVTLSGAGFQPALSLDAPGRLAATVLDAPGRPAEAVVARTEGPTPGTGRRSPRSTQPLRTGLRERCTPPRRPGTRPTAVRCRGFCSGPATAGVPETAATGATGNALPLAVLVHGGPAWLWSSSYAPADVLGLAPALAAAGYLVLLPNPRGSSGRGLEHARAVVDDTGGGDLEDVLSGVRHLVALGLADPSRTAVLGHSYGVPRRARRRPDRRVRRGGRGVGPTDWLSFTHTSNIGGGYDRAYGIGVPQDPVELCRRSAVFAHGGSGTPTLIVHGSQDRVTPVGQAHELYRSLLRAGRAPVELLVYPGEGHEFTDPAHLLDAAARAETWLATHLEPAASALPDGGFSRAPARRG
ncbi:prolyl oligopeptidase family serine peptidase [Streptomyces sp. M10(2022)]